MSVHPGFFICVCMSVSIGLSNCLLTRAYIETQTIQLGGKAGAGKVILLVGRKTQNMTYISNCDAYHFMTNKQ